MNGKKVIFHRLELDAACIGKEFRSGSSVPMDPAAELNEVVDSLCGEANGDMHWIMRNNVRAALPSMEVVASLLEELRSAMFPGYFGASELSPKGVRFHVGATLDRVIRVLFEQIKRGLCFVCLQDEHTNWNECEARSLEMARGFLARIPHVRRMLATDVRAAYEGDPAVSAPDEVVFCYPGFQAITNYRLAHELYQLKVPLIPRMMTELAHSATGIDIHPGAAIGENFFIDHGTGVVIGETTIIGKRVRIYQGVTLGAKSFPLDENGNPVKGVARHPIVGDDVVIYSGATILGRVTIGKGAVIGGNVWLTRSVLPGSNVTQVQARQDHFSDGGGI